MSAPGCSVKDAAALRAEVARLQLQDARLTGLLRVHFAVLRACRVELAHHRVPDGAAKRGLLDAAAEQVAQGRSCTSSA